MDTHAPRATHPAHRPEPRVLTPGEAALSALGHLPLHPGDRQRVRQAAEEPIGDVDSIAAELRQLEAAATRLARSIELSTATFRTTVDLPEGTPHSHVASVTEAAEAVLSKAEMEARVALAIAKTRARSIRRQLDVAMEQPGLLTAPASAMERAGQQRPIVEAQLAGANLAAIRRRLDAARVRDDAGEALALVLTLGPRLATWAVDPEGRDGLALFEARAALRELARPFQDRSLDMVSALADDADRRVSGTERQIIRESTRRTGRGEYGNWGLEQ